MKHVFIMNPSSGKKKKRIAFVENLKASAEALGADYSLYYTKGAGDGQRYAKELCAEHDARGEKLRLYGCGGDGTINELVNGAFGFENVEIGAIPLGTGNDYVRNYGDVSDFLNITGQIRGASVPSDLIRYRAEYEGHITEGYCANMFNIGFDCNVVDLTARVKSLPFISGSLAYLISVGIILIKKKGADLRIEYADGSVSDGKILLTAIANGCYCGGGVKGVPYCSLDDGLMDVSVIKNVSRLFFVALFPSYAKGIHMEKKAIQKRDVINYTKEKTLTVTANGESLRLCTDGEITTQKRIEFSMVKDGFRFILPEGL
ncbi:MAG: diacylglycerol kinase family protein [Bacillota bacterium]|nr:diacylglycerol kinase family protein [Bacillota bacterium]